MSIADLYKITLLKEQDGSVQVVQMEKDNGYKINSLDLSLKKDGNNSGYVNDGNKRLEKNSERLIKVLNDNTVNGKNVLVKAYVSGNAIIPSKDNGNIIIPDNILSTAKIAGKAPVPTGTGITREGKEEDKKYISAKRNYKSKNSMLSKGGRKKNRITRRVNKVLKRKA